MTKNKNKSVAKKQMIKAGSFKPWEYNLF